MYPYQIAARRLMRAPYARHKRFTQLSARRRYWPQTAERYEAASRTESGCQTFYPSRKREVVCLPLCRTVGSHSSILVSGRTVRNERQRKSLRAGNGRMQCVVLEGVLLSDLPVLHCGRHRQFAHSHCPQQPAMGNRRPHHQNSFWQLPLPKLYTCCWQQNTANVRFLTNVGPDMTSILHEIVQQLAQRSMLIYRA